MGSLNGEASQVVRAGRSALRATGTDSERVQRALATRLGPHAFPPTHPVTSSARLRALRAIAGVAMGAGTMGGVLYAATARPNEGTTASVVRPHRQVARASTQPLASPPAEPGTDATPAAEPTVSAEPTSASPVSAPRRQDALTQEVALLSRAVSALNAGRAGDALATLNEHQRRFPRGILGPDRKAAKAQALCSLGRLREGRAELAYLSAKSPAAGRAKHACDSLATPVRPKQD